MFLPIRKTIPDPTPQTYRNVEQLPDRLVVSRATVSHRQGVHTRPSQDRVLVGDELGYQGVGLFEAAIHCECYTDCETAEDLLMLALTGILKLKKGKGVYY